MTQNFKSITRAINRGHLEVTADAFNVYVVTKTNVKKRRNVHLTVPKRNFESMSGFARKVRDEIKTRRNRKVKHYEA